jgi:hypothetical protein
LVFNRGWRFFLYFIFFVIAYYFAKFLVIKLTPLVLKIKREEEAKQDHGQDD